VTVFELIEALMKLDANADVVVRQDGDVESFDEVRRVEYVDDGEATVALVTGDQWDDAPYVCPGCYAVAGPCLPGCIDAEIERDRQDSIERGDYDRDDEEDPS